MCETFVEAEFGIFFVFLWYVLSRYGFINMATSGCWWLYNDENGRYWCQHISSSTSVINIDVASRVFFISTVKTYIFMIFLVFFLLFRRKLINCYIKWKDSQCSNDLWSINVSYVSDLVVGTQGFYVIGIASINEKTSLLVSKH